VVILILSDIISNHCCLKHQYYFYRILGCLTVNCQYFLKLRSMFDNLSLNECLFQLVVDLLTTSPHILTLSTLLIVIVMIKIIFYKEGVVLLVNRTMFFVFFQDTGYTYKLKLCRSYCSGTYGNEVRSLEDDVLQDLQFVENSSHAFIKLTI